MGASPNNFHALKARPMQQEPNRWPFYSGFFGTLLTLGLLVWSARAEPKRLEDALEMEYLPGELLQIRVKDAVLPETVVNPSARVQDTITVKDDDKNLVKKHKKRNKSKNTSPSEEEPDPKMKNHQRNTRNTRKSKKKPTAKRRSGLVQPKKPKVTGQLDSQIIRHRVSTYISEVRSCYNKGLAQDPTLKGRVVVQLGIGANGKVTNAVVQSSTLKYGSVGNCIANAAKNWTFPKPEDGKKVLVGYPFVLSPN